MNGEAHFLPKPLLLPVSQMQPLTLHRHPAAFSLLIFSIFHRFLPGLPGSRECPPHISQTQPLFIDVCVSVYLYIFIKVEDPSLKKVHLIQKSWRSLNACQRCN